LRRLQLLGKTSYEGVKPIVEIPYVFAYFSFAVVEMFTQGFVISLFLEYFGEKFLKEVPICDCPLGNLVKPIIGLSNKSVREKFHLEILMLVIVF